VIPVKRQLTRHGSIVTKNLSKAHGDVTSLLRANYDKSLEAEEHDGRTPLWKMAYEGSESREEFQKKADLIVSTKTGHLFKQGKHRKNWKLRRLAIVDGRLQYSKDGVMKGAVDLTSGQIMLTIQPEGTEKSGNSGSSEWRFECSNGESHLMLAANSEEEMYAWVHAIETVGRPLNIAQRLELLRTKHQGQLYKQGGLRRNWKERMVMLSAGSLQYDKNGTVKGAIELNPSVEVVLMPEGSHKTGSSASSEWRFKVANGKESILFAAPTEEEMYAWKQQIEHMAGCEDPASGEVRDSLTTMPRDSFAPSPPLDVPGLQLSGAVVHVGSKAHAGGASLNVGRTLNGMQHTLESVMRESRALTRANSAASDCDPLSDRKDLGWVLHDAAACRDLKGFCESQHCVENLLFWVEVRGGFLSRSVLLQLSSGFCPPRCLVRARSLPPPPPP
jgi:hypothetical protein